jgi:exosortase A
MQRDSDLLAVVDAGTPVPRPGAAAAVAGIVAVFAWVLAWYWPTAADIARIWWRSETFAHGLLVLPIFAWLVWTRRAQLTGLAPTPVPLLAFPLLLAGFAWLLGEMVSVAALSHVALVAMLVVACVGLVGWRIARMLAFALLFLFFGVPIGEFLLPVLMTYTAEFTVGALRLSGVPVYQEGLHFVVPNGRWSVVEACSGIRYLIASLMVGTLYAYLHYRSLARRLLFVAVAIAVPIVANWVRAYLIVMLGYLSNNRLATGVDHLIYGWLFFGVVILLMFWIGSRWREEGSPAPLAASPAVQGAAQGAVSRRWLGVLPLAAATAVFPLLLQQIREPVAPFTVALVAPSPAPGWALADADFAGFRPQYKGHRGELFQAYRRGDGAVIGLYVAYYARQGPDAELVMWGNDLVGPDARRWARVSAGQDELTVGTVRRAVVTDHVRRFAVWHWYWTNGRVVTSDYAAKAVLAFDQLTGQPDDSAFVAMIAPIDEHADEARALVADFLRDHAVGVEALLTRAEARQ